MAGTEAPDVDDPAFVDALKAGDAPSAEAWVRHALPGARSVALRLLRDPSAADDAVQEAFLNAFRALPGFRGEAQLSTWLHRIVVNVALERLRGRRREADAKDKATRELEVGEAELSPRYGRAWGQVEDLAQTSETRQMVRRMIDRLPESARTVLILRDIEELSTRDTAAALELSEGAVKVRLHRARLALKKLIEDGLSDDVAAGARGESEG